MSRSIFVDVVFGFKTSIELSGEDIKALDVVGIKASPVIYTMEDTPTDYIVGKLISSLRSAGEYTNIKFDSSQAAQDKMKAEIFKALYEAGFDVKDKKCELMVNTYYR
jgi:hypothetical protein